MQNGLAPKNYSKKQKKQDAVESNKLAMLNETVNRYAYSSDGEKTFGDITDLLKDFT